MSRRRMTLSRIDPWSVLKFGFVANLCLLAIFLLGFGVLWFFVGRLGLVEKACEVAGEIGFTECGVNGGNLFRVLLLLGLLGAVVQTGVLVFLAFLHNLIADLVGGLSFTYVEDASAGPRRSAPAAPSSAGRLPAGSSVSGAPSGAGRAGPSAPSAPPQPASSPPRRSSSDQPAPPPRTGDGPVTSPTTRPSPRDQRVVPVPGRSAAPAGPRRDRPGRGERDVPAGARDADRDRDPREPPVDGGSDADVEDDLFGSRQGPGH